MIKIISILCLTIATHAHSFSKLAPASGSYVKVMVPYTLGEHKITSDEIQGSVAFDKDKNLVKQGELILPVKSLRHDKTELMCHLQESLTLDYDKSDFPDEHVCKDDELPIEGKNAPAFKNIVASLIEPFKLGSVTVPVR